MSNIQSAEMSVKWVDGLTATVQIPGEMLSSTGALGSFLDQVIPAAELQARAIRGKEDEFNKNFMQ